MTSRKFYVGLFFLFFVFFSVPVSYQYLSLQLQWHDTGHLFRIICNYFQLGDFHSLDWGQDHFNIHFTPIFYLIALLLKISPTLPFYLAIHVLALTLASFVFFIISRDLVSSKNQAFILCLLFVLNPYTMAINLYPHFEVFGMLGLFLLGMGLHAKSWFWTLGGALLTLTTKQDMWLYLLCTIPIFINRNNLKQSAAACILGILYFVIILNGIYPHYWPNAMDRFVHLWAYGSNKTEVLLYLISHPIETWINVFSGQGLLLLLSFILLPLLATWRALGAIAVLYLWLNSSAIDRNMLSYYYSLPSLALLALLTPVGFLELKKICSFKKLEIRKEYLILVLLVPFSLHINLPQGLRRSPNISSIFLQKWGKRESIIRKWLSNSLSKGSVYTQFSLAAYVPIKNPLFVSHLHSTQLKGGEIAPDFVLLDINRTDHAPIAPPVVNHFVNLNKNYRLAKFQDGIYLYQKSTAKIN